MLAADKAAVSSGAAEPASKGGYASHVAAPGASAPSGPPAGHGEYVNHEKPSGATAGFGGAQGCLVLLWNTCQLSCACLVLYALFGIQDWPEVAAFSAISYFNCFSAADPGCELRCTGANGRSASRAPSELLFCRWRRGHVRQHGRAHGQGAPGQSAEAGVGIRGRLPDQRVQRQRPNRRPDQPGWCARLRA